VSEAVAEYVVVRGAQISVDRIAVEEPLEIRVDGEALVVTMRTPGDDLDLAAGFLRTEGIVEDRDDLAALASVAPNVVDCRLAAGTLAQHQAIVAATRAIASTSACGLCGKTRLEQVRVRLTTPLVHVELDDADAVFALCERLRDAQDGFRATGGLHGAALFDASGALRVVREDIGRHNAVDKVLGWHLREAVEEPLALVVSSRAGFEIVQKAAVAGIGTVVAIGAASSLAVDLAADIGMSLLGFVRRDGFNRYS
jgi:FdhD protein